MGGKPWFVIGLLAAIAVLPMTPVATAAAPPVLSRGVSMQLENTFAAVRSVADSRKPTIGDLLRRIRFLDKQGTPAIFPAFTWPETQHRADIVLEGIEFGDCSRCATLVLRGRGPKDFSKKSPIQLAGSFVAGIDREGNLLCVGPVDTDAARCPRAPWR